MDAAPVGSGSVLYTWGTFAILAMCAFPCAETLALKHAKEVGERTVRPVPLTHLRMLNIVLGAYTLIVFYLTVILGSVIVSCGLEVLHLLIEATLRLDPMTIKMSQRLLKASDNLLDPGLVFAFLGRRFWTLHAWVLVGAIAGFAVHTFLFIDARRIRRLKLDPKKPPPPTMFMELYYDSSSVVTTLIISFYAVVVCREIALVTFLQQEN